IARQPVVDGLERSRLQPTGPPLRLAPARDEARGLHHLQMPRHSRQADVEGLRNLVHGRFPLGEPRKNRPPRRIRERREGDGKRVGHYLTHYEINTVAKYTATANLSSRPESMTSGGVTSPTIATSPLSGGRNHVLFRERSRTQWKSVFRRRQRCRTKPIPGTVSISALGLREQCPICANAAPLWRRGIRPSTSGDRRMQCSRYVLLQS